jgi:hypothetical protein
VIRKLQTSSKCQAQTQVLTILKNSDLFTQEVARNPITVLTYFLVTFISLIAILNTAGIWSVDRNIKPQTQPYQL